MWAGEYGPGTLPREGELVASLREKDAFGGVAEPGERTVDAELPALAGRDGLDARERLGEGTVRGLEPPHLADERADARLEDLTRDPVARLYVVEVEPFLDTSFMPAHGPSLPAVRTAHTPSNTPDTPFRRALRPP